MPSMDREMIFFWKKAPSFYPEPFKVEMSYLVYRNLKNFRVQILKRCGSVMRAFTVVNTLLGFGL